MIKISKYPRWSVLQDLLNGLLYYWLQTLLVEILYAEHNCKAVKGLNPGVLS